jgi:hypothetical protein
MACAHSTLSLFHIITIVVTGVLCLLLRSDLMNVSSISVKNTNRHMIGCQSGPPECSRLGVVVYVVGWRKDSFTNNGPKTLAKDAHSTLASTRYKQSHDMDGRHIFEIYPLST